MGRGLHRSQQFFFKSRYINGESTSKVILHVWILFIGQATEVKPKLAATRAEAVEYASFIAQSNDDYLRQNADPVDPFSRPSVNYLFYLVFLASKKNRTPDFKMTRRQPPSYCSSMLVSHSHAPTLTLSHALTHTHTWAHALTLTSLRCSHDFSDFQQNWRPQRREKK